MTTTTLLRIIAVPLLVSYTTLVALSVYMASSGYFFLAAGVGCIVLDGRFVIHMCFRGFWPAPEPPPLDLDKLCEELGGRPERTARIDAEGKIID